MFSKVRFIKGTHFEKCCIFIHIRSLLWVVFKDYRSDQRNLTFENVCPQIFSFGLCAFQVLRSCQKNSSRARDRCTYIYIYTCINLFLVCICVLTWYSCIYVCVWCIYIHIYIYICIYTCMKIFIYVYICVYIFRYVIYTYIKICIYVYVYVYLFRYILTVENMLQKILSCRPCAIWRATVVPCVF